MGDNNFIYGAGTQLLNTTSFVPAGRIVEFVLKAPFNPNATYFVKIEAPYARKRPFGGRDSIAVSRIQEQSPYVERGLATTNDSLARVQISAEVSGFWRTATVRIYSCESASPTAPVINSVLKVRVSSGRWSSAIVTATTIIIFLGAAYAFRAQMVQPAPGRGRWRFLNPVALTAGTDGRGSLAKLQIMFFSIIVFALLLYVLVRTGELSDLSSTILLLLGIAAVGSTAAKATDVKQNRFSFENWTWLVSKGWLQLGGPAAVNTARWSDLVTSDGEFDVYRYQSCIFSLIVGSALVFVGVYQLASFEIPQALLGLLGLSQVVYVTGKLVSPTAIADADRAITALRGLEQSLRVSSDKLAIVPPDPNNPALKDDVRNYRASAQAAALMFASATGLQKPTNYEPSLI